MISLSVISCIIVGYLLILICTSVEFPFLTKVTTSRTLKHAPGIPYFV